MWKFESILWTWLWHPLRMPLKGTFHQKLEKILLHSSVFDFLSSNFNKNSKNDRLLLNWIVSHFSRSCLFLEIRYIVENLPKLACMSLELREKVVWYSIILQHISFWRTRFFFLALKGHVHQNQSLVFQQIRQSKWQHKYIDELDDKLVDPNYFNWHFLFYMTIEEKLFLFFYELFVKL